MPSLSTTQHTRIPELTATVACSKTEWAQVEECYAALDLDDHRLYHPDFFLASVSSESWNPIVILVRDGNQKPVGLLYLKERKFAGINSSLFFADATLGSVVVSAPENEQDVFETAMSALLAQGQVRGLRLFASPSGYQAGRLEKVAAAHNLEFKTSPIVCHFSLPLPVSYELFLAQLSYKTRRNFRYFRKRSIEAGHVYHDNLSLAETIPALRKLESECHAGGSKESLERAIEILRKADKPLLLALKSAEGELLSFVGGWQEGRRVVILIQLNSDKRHAKYSLSLVMRTHLLERQIELGCQEIFWLGGVADPIRTYCTPIPTHVLCLDSRSLFWRLARRFISSIRHKLPNRLRVQVELAMPSETSQGSIA